MPKNENIEIFGQKELDFLSTENWVQFLVTRILNPDLVSDSTNRLDEDPDSINIDP
jgi:hypothetical protein